VKSSTAKAKGRDTENSFVAYARTVWGLTHIERRRLMGSADQGDVTGWPGVCVEIKSGARIDVAGWLAELDAEIANACATTGFVAVRPKGKPNPDEWYALLHLPTLMRLMADAGWMPADNNEEAA
jgi:hypothetical protein